MKYSVIKRSEINDLMDEVNRAIEYGWKPIGGIAVESTPGSEHAIARAFHRYVQAIVIEDDSIFSESQTKSSPRPPDQQ